MMSAPVDITLLPFQPADQQAVRDLILAGLAEHWGALDPARNPDLEDIATSYAGAVFLVARQAGRIIGCGALVPRTVETAGIVRMSVAADVRRQGVGRLILSALVENARSSGLRFITLETTATWTEVIAFYLRFGFRITHHQDDDVYFLLVLD